MTTFSPLARGFASWAGEVDIQEAGIHIYKDGRVACRPESRPRSCFPSIETESVHRHGITVSPRAQTAWSNNSGYRSASHTGKINGQMVLPKTYVTRKGALLLFTAPDCSEFQLSEQERLQLKNGIGALKSKELKAKFGSLQKFVASVLSFGDLNYEADTASISDPKNKTVLQFLHNLDHNEMVDWKTQPGGDLHSHLHDLKSRTPSARFAFGDPYELDEESKVRTAVSSSMGGRDLISAGTEQLVDQLARPSSQSSIRVMDGRHSSHSSQHGYPGLSTDRLVSSLKSSKYHYSSVHQPITEIHLPPDHDRMTTCTPTSDQPDQRSRPLSTRSRSSRKSSAALSAIAARNARRSSGPVADGSYLGLDSNNSVHENILPESSQTISPLLGLNYMEKDWQNTVNMSDLEWNTNQSPLDSNTNPINQPSLVHEQDLRMAMNTNIVPNKTKKPSLRETPPLTNSDTWRGDDVTADALDEVEIELLDEAATMPHRHSLVDTDDNQSEEIISVDVTRPLVAQYPVSMLSRTSATFSMNASVPKNDIKHQEIENDVIASEFDEELQKSHSSSPAPSGVNMYSSPSPSVQNLEEDAAQVIYVDIRGGDLGDLAKTFSPSMSASTTPGPPGSSPDIKGSATVSTPRRTSVSSVRSGTRVHKQDLTKPDSSSLQEPVLEIPGYPPANRPITPSTAVQAIIPSPHTSQVLLGPEGDADRILQESREDFQSKDAGFSSKSLSETEDQDAEPTPLSQNAIGDHQIDRSLIDKIIMKESERQSSAVPKASAKSLFENTAKGSEGKKKHSGAKPKKTDSKQHKLAEPKEGAKSARSRRKHVHKESTPKNNSEEPKKQFTKAFDITSVQGTEKPVEKTAPQPLSEKSEDLVKDTKKEIERLFGVLPTPPSPTKRVKKEKEKDKERKEKESLAKQSLVSISFTPPEEDEEAEEQELDTIEEEVHQILAPSEVTQEGEDAGLSLEELKLEEQMLKEKLAAAEKKVKSSEKSKNKTDGKKGGAKKEKKEKQSDSSREEELAKRREALREKRKQEKERRLGDALKMQEKIKVKEEERLKKEAAAAARKQKLEAELMEIAREAEEIRKAEEEARAALAEARRIAREEREARRKVEIEKKKEEANKRREKERQMQEAARRKERDMLERIGGTTDRKKLDEKEQLLQEEDEWYREQERMQEDEELARLAREEEKKYSEMEREAEEEAMAHLLEEREAAEKRRNLLQREAKHMAKEEEIAREIARAEQLALEEEMRRRETAEAIRHEEERQRLIELQRQEEEARMQMSAEVQARRDAALQRRDVNLERRNHLDGVRRNQGMTRPWVFSYYVAWPRESYEKLMGGINPKKRGFRPKPKPPAK